MYANGILLATYTNSETDFVFSDWLGTKRVVASADGSVKGTCLSLPFGDDLNCTGGSLNGHHFTGQIHDQETGNDYFNTRYYSNGTGRFLSPDPSGLSFANPANPQSLNLYNYSLNNPLINIDPTGMECVWDDGSYDPADDPYTGNAAGCSGQGGTYVNPDLFENALLTNGQNANIQYGSWSNQANPTIASSWLMPSSTTTGLANPALTLNVPMNVWIFATQQTTPVHGPWHYGNWAGPGGSGAPIDNADAGAMMHDYCYHQGNFSPTSNLFPNASLQARNQALCDTESEIVDDLDRKTNPNGDYSVYAPLTAAESNERAAASEMVDFFTYGVVKGNQCHH